MVGSPIAMLDGNVQSQGVKVSARDWLDMGSEGWSKVPNKVKAAAYQAAKVTGWRDEGLRSIMVNNWGPRIDHDMATFTLDLLRELAKEFPLEVEQVHDAKPATEIRLPGDGKKGRVVPAEEQLGDFKKSYEVE